MQANPRREPPGSVLVRDSQYRLLWDSILASTGLHPESNFDLNHFHGNLFMEEAIKFPKIMKVKLLTQDENSGA